MMLALQLNPPLPVETPRGKAMAHAMIDYGPEMHLLWVCFLDESRECWTVRNDEVRLQKNESMRPKTAVPPLAQRTSAVWRSPTASAPAAAPASAETK